MICGGFLSGVVSAIMFINGSFRQVDLTRRAKLPAVKLETDRRRRGCERTLNISSMQPRDRNWTMENRKLLYGKRGGCSLGERRRTNGTSHPY